MPTKYFRIKPRGKRKRDLLIYFCHKNFHARTVSIFWDKLFKAFRCFKSRSFNEGPTCKKAAFFSNNITKTLSGFLSKLVFSWWINQTLPLEPESTRSWIHPRCTSFYLKRYVFGKLLLQRLLNFKKIALMLHLLLRYTSYLNIYIIPWYLYWMKSFQ